MSNLEIYTDIFSKTLKIDPSEVKTVTYRSIQGWDSIGHMVLISAIEDAFSLMFETTDIIEFTSFENGLGILKKYNVIS